MDITGFVFWAFFIGFILGMAAMYGIVEYHFYKDNKNREKSMLDFAEYVEHRRNKQIDFNIFDSAGGSFDEK